jgi:arylformamidase
VRAAEFISDQWIDVSVTIQDGMVHWPGDDAVSIRRAMEIKKGDDANVTAISMSAHTGTHIDAPLHFIDGGKDISQVALSKMVGKATVVEILNSKSITVEKIKLLNISEGHRILFKTDNSKHDWTMQSFNKHYIYLEGDAARYLCDKGVVCVGIDYLSIGGEQNEKEVHQTLLEAEIVIIEGLNLRHVSAGEYEMVCLPLKLSGADGAPARVILKRS